MTTRYYFVDPAPCRADLLRMEVELVHTLKNDIAGCVLSEESVRQYVEDLKAVQDSISHANPRLRRVEITFRPDRSRFMDGYADFITIGQYGCALRPVRKIQ